MVINGGSRSGSCSYTSYLGTHLQRTDTNERVHVREVYGVAAADLTGAFREMSAVGEGSRSRLPLYHANIDWRHDEIMTDAQKARAIERLGEELGLANQPRVVVEHVKDGREHLHVVWSRIDADTMTAIPNSHNYRRHEIVARELEREFEHARVQGAHVERDGVERPARCPTLGETRQAERSGMIPEEAKAQLRDLWQSADNGQAFAAALDHAGWTLAQGDRRGFVALDPSGEVHAVNKAVTGLTAAQVRERLADLDAGSLPSVDAARDQLRARQHESEALAIPEPEYIEPGLAEAIAIEPPPREGVEEAAPAQAGDAPLKSPENMRREWAALMRDGVEPEIVPEPALSATTGVEAFAGSTPEPEASLPSGRESKASDPAAARKAWADRLREFDDKPDPTAERKAWAERLRDFGSEKTPAVTGRKPALNDTRDNPLAFKPAEEAPKAQHRSWFERIRTFVRSWWEPKTPTDPQPVSAPGKQSDDSRVRRNVEIEPSPASSPAKPAATLPQSAEPVRRRSVSQEMLDEAQAEIDARRSAETPAQRSEREKRSSDAARGRDRGNGDRERYHHSLLLDLPQPWQHRRTNSRTPQIQP